MKVPLHQWVGIDLVCGLGKQETKTYDLAVRLPGQPSQGGSRASLTARVSTRCIG